MRMEQDAADIMVFVHGRKQEARMLLRFHFSQARIPSVIHSGAGAPLR